jgi:hypothetical protein
MKVRLRIEALSIESDLLPAGRAPTSPMRFMPRWNGN